MTNQINRLTVILLVCLLTSGFATATEPTCSPKGQLNFCIDEFQTNRDVVTKGNVVEGEVTVTNIGNKSGSVVVLIGLRASTGEFTYHRAGVIHDLAPGESQPYEFQLVAQEDSTLGEHKMNIRIFDTPEKHLYDSTGYTSSIYLKDDPITIDEILENFNRFSVGLSAAVGLVAYFLGKRHISLR